jgi:hypothetical protein
VGHLERRAAEATVDIDQRVGHIEEQKKAIEQALAEATRAADVVSALDARIATLTDPGQSLDHAAETVGHLERRVAEATADLDRRVGNVEGQKQAIEQAVANAMHALDARIATLTGPGQLLDHAAETVGHLERRTAEATADLDRRVGHVEGQKQAIEQAVAVAMRALDARIATLTGPGQLLDHAAQTAAHLERRTAEATVDLDRRVGHVEGQKQAIEQAVAAAMHALDARIASLTGPGQLLDRAAATVGHLERRAAAATANLEHVARAKSELVKELLGIQKHLQALTESVQNDVGASVADQPELEIPRVMPVSPVAFDAAGVRAETGVETSVARNVVRNVVRNTVRPGAGGIRPDEAVPSSDGGVVAAPKTPQPGRRRTVGFVALALGLMGALVMHSRSQPAEMSGLPSRTWDFAALSVPLDSTGMVAPIPTNDTGSATRPTAVQVSSRAVVDVAAGRSAAAPARARGTASSSLIESDADPVQQFSGMLGVESVPAGAAVFINQKRVGQTPLSLTRVRAGSHVLWIEREGYERWTTSVLVPADQQIRVSAKLQAVRKR